MKLSIMNGSQSNFTPVFVETDKALEDVIKTKTYSLGTFRNDHRTNENFERAELIGLDFDDSLSLVDAQNLFKDQWHIIGTTRNHQKEKNGITCDRFRVILKAERVIDSNSDYKATVLAIFNDFPQADKACSDAARMFFQCNEIISSNTEGKLQPVVKYERPSLQVVDAPAYLKGRLAKSTMEFILFGATEGSWNSAIYRAALDLNEQKYSHDEALTLLTKATINYNGELDSRDLGSIKSAYDKDPKYAPRGTDGMFDFKHPTDMSGTMVELPWLIDGLMIRGGISLLAGASKAGKSTITRQLAMAVSRGHEWLGRKVHKGKVLYLALEEQEYMLSHQLKKLGLNKDDNILYHVGAPNIGDLKDNLTQAIEHYKADLIVVDTMILLAQFENVNDYKDVYEKLSIFRNIARQTDSHIMMIHHTNKMGGALGSTAILGAVDCYIRFSEVPGSPRYRVIESKQRGGVAFSDQRLEYIEEQDIYLPIDGSSSGAF